MWHWWHRPPQSGMVYVFLVLCIFVLLLDIQSQAFVLSERSFFLWTVISHVHHVHPWPCAFQTRGRSKCVGGATWEEQMAIVGGANAREEQRGRSKCAGGANAWEEQRGRSKWQSWEEHTRWRSKCVGGARGAKTPLYSISYIMNVFCDVFDGNLGSLPR
jgi:hypothetical protein